MFKRNFFGKTNSNSYLQAIFLKNRDQVLFWPLVLTITLLIASIGLLALKFGSLPPQLPLFYSRPWGEAMLAKTSTIFILPIIVLALTIVDFVLYLKLVKSNVYLAKILILTFLVSATLITWTLVKVVFLVS